MSCWRATVEPVPYSSMVGGGLMVKDESGRARFIITAFGTTEGITKEETEALMIAIQRGFSGGVAVPYRAQQG